MYLKMAGEALNGNYESLTDDELKQQLEALRKQVEEMSKVLEKRQWTENPQRTWDQTNDSDLNVDNVHLYSWWGKKLEKSGVLDVIKSLKEPYRTEVNWFVKNNDVLGLQRYLNAKIDSGAIDRTKLESALSAKSIWLRDGHLLEDWKFWPQTMETIKVLAELPGEKADEQKKQEAIAEENRDVAGLTPVVEDAKRVRFTSAEQRRSIFNPIERWKVNVYNITDINKVPATWTWTDEKKVYRYKVASSTVWGVATSSYNYDFYNDGMCVRRESGMTTKSGEEFFKTDTILSKLKSGEYKWSVSDKDVKQSIVDSIKENCIDALKTDKWETVKLDLDTAGNKVKAYLDTWVPCKGNPNINYSAAVEINVKDCLKTDWTLDKKYVEDVILKSAKEELVKQKKTVVWRKALLDNYWPKSPTSFSKSNLFWNEYKDKPAIEAYLEKYFKKFDNSIWELDGDTTFNMATWQIKMEFDDDNWNEKYNVWKTNPNLIISWSDIVNDDYSFNEKKFKKILRNIILKIIDSPEFK